ncbi:MAG: TonB-dependent receptor [Bryobacteraceae bacterium]
MTLCRHAAWSCVLTFALFSSALLKAQTAAVSGTVTDVSGAAVPSAEVSLNNLADGGLRSTESSASGTFSLPALTPGRYDVSVRKKGFATYEFRNVELTVDQALTLNPRLQVGPYSQVLTVRGDAVAPVDLEDDQSSTVIDSRRILALPLLVRDPYSLVSLSPGVVQTNSALGGFAVNGSRERNNNFLLDGADNNDTSVPGAPAGLVSLNPESTQEFRVISSNFLPEFGRNTGAIIDVISRSGSNQLHGDAYWFGRYSALAARDYFNTKPNPENPFVRNDFGWSLGGPIKKDKTFFFVNTEYQRFRTTLTEASIVPTAAFKSGVFTFDGYPVDLRDPGSPNNVLGLPLDPTIQKALALLPNPNGESVDDVRGIYRFPSTSRLNSAATTFKLDHRFTENESFFIRYSYGGQSDPDAFHDEIAPGLGATGTAEQVHSISANLISTLRPSLVNQFTAGVNRPTDNFNCGGYQQFDALGNIDPFGNGSDYALSGIPVIGCGELGDSDGQMRRTGTWSLNDGLAWVKGNHSFKFGAEFRYVFENGYDAFSSRTLYNFDAFSLLGQPIVNLDPANPCNPTTNSGCGSVQFQDLAAGLLGFVAEQNQAQFFNLAGDRTAVDYRHYVQHEYAEFAQDIWKVWPNLTLSYGLRYQFNGVPFERNGELSNLFQNPAGFSPFTFSLIGSGATKNLYNNDPLNFEPRFGFSWDPFSKGKTAIRAGYGIFHDRIFGNLFENAGGNPPFLEDVAVSPQTTLPNAPVLPTLATSATVTDGAFLEPVIIDHNLKMPVSQSWNFSVQQELPGLSTLELAYVASKGNHEFRVVNGNQPIPALVNAQIAAGVPPSALQFSALYFNYPTTNNTAFYEPSVIKSIGNSTYHSLQANWNKRLSYGMQIQAAYTWSHSIDDAPDPLNPGAGGRSFPRNSFDLQEERGSSDFDQRQRLVLNYVLDVPVGKGKAYANSGIMGRVLEGWQFAGISVFQSGLPFDIYGNVDTEHTGLSSRPDLVGNTAIPAGSDRTQTGPPITAFAIAPFGSPGNLGRNVFVGPGVINTDVVLSKTQSLGERVQAQLRFEVYNLFNRVQFAQPGNDLADPGTFGISTTTLTRPDGTSSNRQIQVALKLRF